VRRIAGDNNISDAELDGLAGTGQNGRVTKKDLLQYVEDKRAGRVQPAAPSGARAPAGGAPSSFAPSSGARPWRKRRGPA